MTTRLTADEERALITQVSDDPQAFRALYRAYFDRIYAYIAYRVNTQEDAEDITAETFTRVVEHITQFDDRGTGSFAAWLFRIAYNQVQAFYRRQARSAPIILDALGDLASEALSPDETLMQKEQYARLRQMVATLSPRRQEVISLKFFGELRNQEIAEILDLDERTVASHLCRAIEDLQAKYDRYPSRTRAHE